MAPYRPPHMRNQPPLPKLVCSNRDEVIRTQPSQTDTIATLTANLAEEFHVPEELISLAKRWRTASGHQKGVDHPR